MSMESLKVVVADHLKKKRYTIFIDGKAYDSDKLAEEVLKESEVGVKVLQMVVKGTLERYGTSKEVKR
jgi:23S rRNA pseudoU1915 N3-methylase RlmH